jgi:hypothetical protein
MSTSTETPATPAETPAPAAAAPAATPAPAAAEAPKTQDTAAKRSALTAAAAKDPAAAPAPEAKAKEPASDAPLEVKLPEGVVVDQGLLTAFAQQAKEAGMNGEQASKLAAWYAGQEKARAEEWGKQSDRWYDSLEKDPDFGGKHTAENMAAYQAAVKQFGGEQLVKDLQAYGIDNMPSLVRAFAAAGKALAEQRGAIVETRTAPKLTPEQERLYKRYPSLAPQQQP